MSGYTGHLPSPSLKPCLDTLVIFRLHLSSRVWIHWSSRPFGHLPFPPLKPCLDTLVILTSQSLSLPTSQAVSGYTGHLPSPPLNPCLDTLVILTSQSLCLPTSQAVSGYTGLAILFLYTFFNMKPRCYSFRLLSTAMHPVYRSCSYQRFHSSLSSQSMVGKLNRPFVILVLYVTLISPPLRLLSISILFTQCLAVF